MDTLERNITGANLILLYQYPFFAALCAEKLTVKLEVPKWADPRNFTAATDGQTVWYGPDFVRTLTVEQTVFLMIHEIKHAMHLHSIRGKRYHSAGIVTWENKAAKFDWLKWNIAGDYIINAWNVRCKIGDFIPKGLLDTSIATGDEMVEEVYVKLFHQEEPEDQPQPPGGDEERDDEQEGSSGEDQEGGTDEEEQGSDEPGEGEGDQGQDGEEERGQEPEPRQGEDPGSGEEQGEPGAGDDASHAGSEGAGQSHGPAPGGVPGDRSEPTGREPTGPVSHRMGQTLDQVVPPPLSGETGERAEEQEEREWQDAIQSAAEAAKAQGKFPGELEKLVDTLLKPKSRWREKITEFVHSKVGVGERQWKRIDRRRLLLSRVIMPGKRQDKCPPVGVILDSSGSVIDEAPQFMSELWGLIQDVDPEVVRVASADTMVRSCVDLEDTVGISHEQVVNAVKVRGGGGTSFIEPLEKFGQWARTLDNPPAFVVLFTDTMGDFPHDPPGYPLLVAYFSRYKDYAKSWVPAWATCVEIEE